MQMNFNGFFPPSFMLHVETTHEENQQQELHLPHNPGHLLGVGKRSMSFPGIEACEEVNMDAELSDDTSAAGEKKRRLNVEQVRMLERSFELGSKLEPERKMQLSRALGLKPRQIAIWFQNRRARWKTKQLEKDYDALKQEFEAMKLDNEALQAQNRKLHAEILALKGIEKPEPINLNKETEGSCSNRSENTSEVNMDISRATTAADNPLDSQQGISFFPTYKPANTTQVLHNSLKLEVQCPKIEHGVHDESFSNLLCSIDDQSGFWTWSEHNNYQTQTYSPCNP